MVPRRILPLVLVAVVNAGIASQWVPAETVSGSSACFITGVGQDDSSGGSAGTPGVHADRAPSSAPAARMAAPARWDGVLVRRNKDLFSLTVRRGNIDKKIQYDRLTKWTRGDREIHLANRPADLSDLKDGAKVNVLGNYDKNGVLHATRIHLGPEPPMVREAQPRLTK
jgi:hypothetical protein